jgi:hypothetical protein
LIGLSAALLSGCGWEWPEWEPLRQDPFEFVGKTAKSEEEIARMRGDTTVPPPPSVIPMDEPDQNDPQSALVPASTMGLNLDTYFAQDIDDPQLRLMRLENALVAMHKDMRNIPGANKLPQYQNPMPVSDLLGAPVEDETPPPVQAKPVTPVEQQSVEPREVIASGGPENLIPSDSKPPSTPVYEPPKPAPAPKVSSTPIDANGPTTVHDLRVGTHADKVRIVMDLNKKTLYTADLDNAENILIIELPDAAWSTTSQQSFGNNPLIKSYSVDPYNEGKGHIVAIQLKSSSSILKQDQIPAHNAAGQRIFIDLAR